MQPKDDELGKEEKQEKLDQDFAPPFSPADDIENARRVSKEDPHLDDGADSDEWYQEGAAAAGGLPDDDSEDEDQHARRVA
jgi:hypothetical protein